MYIHIFKHNYTGTYINLRIPKRRVECKSSFQFFKICINNFILLLEKVCKNWIWTDKSEIDVYLSRLEEALFKQMISVTSISSDHFFLPIASFKFEMQHRAKNILQQHCWKNWWKQQEAINGGWLYGLLFKNQSALFQHNIFFKKMGHSRNFSLFSCFPYSWQ